VAEYVSRDEFIEALMQHFNVVVEDVYYESLASLEINEYEFEEFLCIKFGEERLRGTVENYMSLNDVYSNLFY